MRAEGGSREQGLGACSSAHVHLQLHTLTRGSVWWSARSLGSLLHTLAWCGQGWSAVRMEEFED